MVFENLCIDPCALDESSLSIGRVNLDVKDEVAIFKIANSKVIIFM